MNTTASFPLRGRVVEVSLGENAAGVPVGLSLRWMPDAPISMDAEHREQFEDGLAKALQALMPGAYEQLDADEDSDTPVAVAKAQRSDADDARALIKQAHRAGGQPLTKATLPEVKATPRAVLTRLTRQVSTDADVIAAAKRLIGSVNAPGKSARVRAAVALRELHRDPAFAGGAL